MAWMFIPAYCFCHSTTGFVLKRHPNERDVPPLARAYLRTRRELTVGHLRKFLGAKLAGALDGLWPARPGGGGGGRGAAEAGAAAFQVGCVSAQQVFVVLDPQFTLADIYQNFWPGPGSGELSLYYLVDQGWRTQARAAAEQARAARAAAQEKKVAEAQAAALTNGSATAGM